MQFYGDSFDELFSRLFNYSCHVITEIDFAYIKLKFLNYSMFEIYSYHEICISLTSINYVTYWALSLISFFY